MNPAFTIDNKAYDVFVPEGGIRRQGRVTDGPAAGRVLNGDMKRDVLGTFYNYSMQIDTSRLAFDEYDALYEVLSAPVDSHDIEVPYGQSTMLFKAYCTNLDDVLLNIGGSGNLWGELSLNFIAMSPQRKR